MSTLTPSYLFVLESNSVLPDNIRDMLLQLGLKALRNNMQNGETHFFSSRHFAECKGTLEHKDPGYNETGEVPGVIFSVNINMATEYTNCIDATFLISNPKEGMGIDFRRVGRLWLPEHITDSSNVLATLGIGSAGFETEKL